MIDSEQIQLLRQVRLALQAENYNEAIIALQQVANLAHEAGDYGAEGRHLGNLALIYYRIHQPEAALECFEVALDRAQQEGDKLTEDGLLGNMGNILRELERYDLAVDYLNRALIIANEIGDVRGRGRWLANLGLVYDDVREFASAVDYHMQSIEIARHLGDQSGLASRLGNLGNSYVASGDYVTALKYFAEAVQLYESLNDLQGLAVRLGIMGNIYAELGRNPDSQGKSEDYFQSALHFYKRTLALARRLDDPLSEASLLQGIGNVCGNLGQFDRTIECYERSARLYDELGMYDQARFVRHNIDQARDYLDS